VDICTFGFQEFLDVNPYEVLGLSANATDREIKNAYRKLIKQFHPDKNAGEEARNRAVLINEAYEILSDPERRARYDNAVYTSAEQTNTEDPVEAYKREFKRRRWEKEKQKKEEAEAVAAYWEPRIYKVVRILIFPVFAFAFLLVLDNMLPKAVYREVAESGYQVRGGQTRSTKGSLASYMRTSHFVLRVPHELHLDYPYYEESKPVLTIHVTSIFRIPRNIECILNDKLQYFEVPHTIHSTFIALPWLLLTSSFVIVWNGKFSKLMYGLCFLPFLLLAIVLIIML